MHAKSLDQRQCDLASEIEAQAEQQGGWVELRGTGAAQDPCRDQTRQNQGTLFEETTAVAQRTEELIKTAEGSEDAQTRNLASEVRRIQRRWPWLVRLQILIPELDALDGVSKTHGLQRPAPRSGPCSPPASLTCSEKAR